MLGVFIPPHKLPHSQLQTNYSIVTRSVIVVINEYIVDEAILIVAHVIIHLSHLFVRPLIEAVSSVIATSSSSCLSDV